MNDKRITDAIRSNLLLIADDISGILADDLHDEGYSDEEAEIIMTAVENKIREIAK